MVNRARYTANALGYDDDSYFKNTIKVPPGYDNYWGSMKCKLQKSTQLQVMQGFFTHRNVATATLILCSHGEKIRYYMMQKIM